MPTSLDRYSSVGGEGITGMEVGIRVQIRRFLRPVFVDAAFYSLLVGNAAIRTIHQNDCIARRSLNRLPLRWDGRGVL